MVSLYIHFPWCIKKCPYCDFNSHGLKNNQHQLDANLQAQYINCLIQDLTASLKFFNLERPLITSIFMGGGTPSLFSAKNIAELLKKIAQLTDLDKSAEITIEINPGTIEQASTIPEYLAIGINRFSIGCQSFNNKFLKKLGRIHNDFDIKKVLTQLNNLNANFNIDLMWGLPEQTVAEALDDLKMALEFDSSHLSWYQLTLEPNTEFYKNPPKLPHEDKIWQMLENGQKLIKQAGFTQYEVSAYSKPNLESKHNLNYWQFGDYLGIGAGAHSKITDLDKNIFRQVKIKHPKYYLQAENNNFVLNTEPVLVKNQLFEFMLNYLRLNNNANIKEQLIKTTKITLDTLKTSSKSAQDLELMDLEFQPTLLGRRFLNDLIASFIEKDELQLA